ncbi:MAG TPA: DNA translocase FtsK 4TM domain-containing protein, partial [Novosphingobium sp.]|nr:DNA translocase FtsK 4TM domain-containing protein [Novosphingobium sp.]
MASRAGPSARTSSADWRAVLRRSVRRSFELIGGALLTGAMLFLALALVSYTQTDPSGSTASGSPVENWMGLAGAWAAERVLLFFGLPGALLLPLLWVFARRLWDGEGDLIDFDEDEEFVPEPRWWRPTLLLFLAMALLGLALSLWGAGAASRLPAGPGGMAGLLGAAGITALADLVPQVPRLWFTVPIGLAALAGGMAIASRIFAFDWGRMLSLPPFLRRAPRANRLVHEDAPPAPAAKRERREKEARAAAEEIDVDDALAQRKPTEISDSTRAPIVAAAPAKARQGDLFDKYELPSIDLLVEVAAGSTQKVDKLALERNARLLENVLDDFNVKGEITAVRT